MAGLKGASTGRNGDADDRARWNRRTDGMRRDARAHTQPHSTQLPLSARPRLKASSLGFFGVHPLASASIPLFPAMQTLPASGSVARPRAMSVLSGSLPAVHVAPWPVKILTGLARSSAFVVDPMVSACAGVIRASTSSGCNAYGPDGSFPLGETHGSLPLGETLANFCSVVQL